MSQGIKSPQTSDDSHTLPVDDLDVVAPTDEDLAEEEANGVEVEEDLEKDLPPATTDEGFESLEALRDKEEEESEEEYNSNLHSGVE